MTAVVVKHDASLLRGAMNTMKTAQPLSRSRFWAGSGLHVTMLVLTVVQAAAMLLVFRGRVAPLLADWALSLVAVYLCWRAGKGWRLAFWTSSALSIALTVESLAALPALGAVRHMGFYLFLLYHVLLIACLWRLPLHQRPRISAAFCGLLTLFTVMLFFFVWREGQANPQVWQERQANLQAVTYGILYLAALWTLSPAMETALAGRVPMGRFFVILAVVIGWLAAVLKSVMALGLDMAMQDLRPIQAMWLAGDLLFGIGIYCEARKIDVQLWPFMAVGALDMAWIGGLMSLRSAPGHIYQVWLLLGGVVVFICALGVARGYEEGLHLARRRLEGWVAVIDDLSRAADENVDTHRSLEQAFIHLMGFFPGLLGLEIVFRGGSLLLGKAAGHREVLRAEDGRQVALYGLEDNLMANEGMMRAVRPWLTNRLWDLAVKLELRDQVYLDPLSGLLNRRAYEVRLPEVLRLAQAQQRPVAVLMVDMDHFKRVNDTCGHAVGDQVIQAIAKTMRAFFRSGDLVIRWGGEEFLALMLGVDRAQAMERAEQLRKAISALAVPAVTWPLSVSIGVAGGTVPQGQAQLKRWLEEADQALYAAKRAGRNRIRA